MAAARTERSIWCNSMPATATRMENRLSQQEVEHEANAVRNEHRECGPSNRRHPAPHRVNVNVSRKKKVSRGKHPARQTDQGPEAIRPILLEDPEKENREG